jgi:6-phosphogluconolactonase
MSLGANKLSTGINSAGLARTILSIFLALALACAIGCGGLSTLPSKPLNTYLYVGESPLVIVPTGSVAQFRMNENGTLTPLSVSSTGAVLPLSTGVNPTNQYFFSLDEAFGISELGIAGDGSLAPHSAPPFTGNGIAFTPNGQFAIIANGAEVSSYSVSASGDLSLIKTISTAGTGGAVFVEPSGRFVYITGSVGDNFLEYAISADGAITSIGSVPSGGNNANVLVASPNGFFYCANAESLLPGSSGSVSQFALDESTGALALVNNFPDWVPPNPGPSWIAFDHTGAHAYVGNLFGITQFAVNPTTGVLTSLGTLPTPDQNLFGQTDPSGRFLFTVDVGGNVAQYTISRGGLLIPNGSVSLGTNLEGMSLAFAQR